MTTDEKLDYLLKFNDKHVMRNYRLLARMKALEAMLRGAVPEPKLDQWDRSLEREAQIILHDMLNECEKHSPGYAASIDDREPWELALLD